MIGSLRGTLIDRSVKGEALIEVGGVGYLVTVSPSTLSRLGAIDSQVFVHVHTHVREDALVLYGFIGRDERACFDVLLSAHGVGPALALAILSALTPDSLRMAVATDDVDGLTLVPGVGKKTAARLLIELKSKLDVLGGGDYAAAIAAAGGGVVSSEPADSRTDVRAALTELGYGAEEIRQVLRTLPSEGDASALLKRALATLASGL